MSCFGHAYKTASFFSPCAFHSERVKAKDSDFPRDSLPTQIIYVNTVENKKDGSLSTVKAELMVKKEMHLLLKDWPTPLE